VRTQQLIAYESGITDIVDPLGGSYYIEYLTDKIEKEASEYITKIDSLGGALAAIEQGFQQREIQDASYKYQKMIEEGQQAIIGVNKFVSGYPKVMNMLRVNPEVERKQKERLAQVKRERDNAKVEQALKRLEDVARSNENTMPAFLQCVEAYATVGEISDTLRKVFGTQKGFLFF